MLGTGEYLVVLLKIIMHGESPCAEGHNDYSLSAVFVVLRILSGHCRIHREAPGTMQNCLHYHYKKPLSGGAFLWAKKSPQ